MNLFRSEEHARRWTGFEAHAAAGLLSFEDNRHPRHRVSLIRVDPTDAGVRVRASHHAEVSRPGPPEIVQIPPAPLEQRGVFLPAE